jgi:very-short-patch-repair endonuclease
LKTLGFRQQAEILGYIADFAHFGKRVIVEIDGGIHQRADVYEKDRKRNEVLRAHGWIVLHFTDTQVYSDAEQVYASIKAAIGDYAVNTEALAA